MTRFIVSNFSLLATYVFGYRLVVYFLWPLRAMNHFPLISGTSRGNEGGGMKSNAVSGKSSTPIVDVLSTECIVFVSNRKSLLSPRLFSASTFWAREYGIHVGHIPFESGFPGRGSANAYASLFAYSKT